MTDFEYIDKTIKEDDEYKTHVFVFVKGGYVVDAQSYNSDVVVHVIDKDREDNDDCIYTFEWPETQVKEN